MNTSNHSTESFKIKGVALPTMAADGYIRFSYEETDGQAGDEPNSTTQLPEFEILTAVHMAAPANGMVARMKPHPIADRLPGVETEGLNKRMLLREIPITFFGKSPKDVMKARYEAFDVQTGERVCHGNGEKARRTHHDGTRSTCNCPGARYCEFASGAVDCRIHTRLSVMIDCKDSVPGEVFQFQSSGVNTYMRLMWDLEMLYALFGDLRGIPLTLASWEKSSPVSGYKSFWCAKLAYRDQITPDAAKCAQLESLKAKKIAVQEWINWDAGSDLAGRQNAAIEDDDDVNADLFVVKFNTTESINKGRREARAFAESNTGMNPALKSVIENAMARAVPKTAAVEPTPTLAAHVVSTPVECNMASPVVAAEEAATARPKLQPKLAVNLAGML